MATIGGVIGNNNGISGGINTTLPIAMTIASFTAVAWYNSLVLNVMVWTTFKKYTGLYFWSLLVASWGVAIYSLAFLMKFFRVWHNDYVSVTFITIGWYAMVTGQSLVLYSRLHLVVYDRRKIRWILYMIIIDVFLFHVPTTVMTFGSNSPQADKFANPYSIMEKIQVTAFSIQEFIISGIYIWETRRMLQPRAAIHKGRVRKVMRHLIYVNILIMLMDIALLATEYANLYSIQITFKGMLYSIKLQLEFTILNQLMSINSSSNASDPSHVTGVGGGTVGLDTFRGRETSHDGNERSYTVFAGAMDRSPFEEATDDVAAGEGVRKTTRVDVHVEHVEKDQKKSLDGTNEGRSTVLGQRQPKSETSSEIEFAAAGY